MKGSEWESILHPEPISIEDRRMLKDFRAACDSEERKRKEAGRGYYESVGDSLVWRAPEITNAQIEERAKRSAAYIEQAKARKRGEL